MNIQKVIHLIRAAFLKKAGANNKTSSMFGFTTNFSLIDTLKREGAPVEHLQYSADSICNQIGDADEGKFPIRTKNDVSFLLFGEFGPNRANTNISSIS